MPLRVPIARAQYFWVYGKNASTGNSVIVGPFADEDHARDDASNLGDVRVFKLPTRDHSKATRQIKAKVLRTGGVREAMQRMNHKMSGTREDMMDDEGDNDDDDI